MMLQQLQILLIKYMQNPLERERSLKKLHFCIANYQNTQEEKAALLSAQQDLKDKIEFKYRKSAFNQGYVFPRKIHTKDQYSDTLEIVNLHNQIQVSSELELKQKPKIKLGKGRAQKRLQTEHFDRSSIEENEPRKIEQNRFAFKCKPLCQNNQSNYPAPSAKQRVKTEYYRQQPLRKEMSAKKLQTLFFSNTLQRDLTNSKGKSKLNILTKSYMNLKTAKSGLEVSVDPQPTNYIRSNDYKFMPNSTTNHRNYTSNTVTAGFNSTRQFKNMVGASGYSEIMKEVINPKSLQKIESLLPSNKRFFKAR